VCLSKKSSTIEKASVPSARYDTIHFLQFIVIYTRRNMHRLSACMRRVCAWMCHGPSRHARLSRYADDQGARDYDRRPEMLSQLFGIVRDMTEKYSVFIRRVYKSWLKLRPTTRDQRESADPARRTRVRVAPCFQVPFLTPNATGPEILPSISCGGSASENDVARPPLRTCGQT
jgi:hypothetical protein